MNNVSLIISSYRQSPIISDDCRWMKDREEFRVKNALEKIFEHRENIDIKRIIMSK